MSQLCITLPPFSPDYSGVASALFELGGMIVIHDASGCTGNYLGYDEPRWMNSQAMVYCSGLRHMDAVLGNDSKLVKRIVAAAESLKPRFIALLGSPVPMIIGTDYKGIAAELENKTGIPAFGFDTKGIEFYDKGITAASIALLERFAPAGKSYKKLTGTINITGLTPLDFGNRGNAEDFASVFKRNGISINTSFSMGMNLDEVVLAPCAELDVAVSQAGVETAKYMQRTYGIPYISGVPLGDGSSLTEAVKDILHKKNSFLNVSSTSMSHSHKHILIAGEQVIACSIRNELRLKYGCKDISVAVLFNASEELLERNDYTLVTEEKLCELLNSGMFTDVVADPLIEQLIKIRGVRFFGLPHTAVSSKVYWDETERFVSHDMELLLKKIAEIGGVRNEKKQ